MLLNVVYGTLIWESTFQTHTQKRNVLRAISLNLAQGHERIA